MFACFCGLQIAFRDCLLMNTKHPPTQILWTILLPHEYKVDRVSFARYTEQRSDDYSKQTKISQKKKKKIK